MSPTYVSLDLETTGLDPHHEQIIEVAAVRFQDGEVLDTFHCVVNPGRALSRHIQWLCGLSSQEVSAAPPFAEIAPKLASFLGSSVLVGHNLAFDLGFLSASGLPVTNAHYDTWELAAILMPSLPDHSLKTVATHFGHTIDNHHRALPDALAVVEVFKGLMEKAAAVRPSLLEETLHQPSRAFAIPGPPSLLPALSPASAPLTPRATRQEIPDLSPFLEPGGRLAQVLPGYEHRAEQAAMMTAVARAFNQGHHLMVEAGTGTGKSLAYLLPALLFAVQNRRPVVVSTHTLNLQEQLLNKDIPALMRLVEGEPKVVALKGRGNYLCPWCLERERQRLLEPRDANFFLKLDVWLPTTKTGDRAELRFTPQESGLWSTVSAQTEACLQGECPHLHKGACFLGRAREAARAAHMVLVNHALLVADLESPVLPPYRHLIVDEAHHLEEEATRQLGYRLTEGDFSDFTRRFARLGGKPGKALADRLSQKTEGFFGTLARFINDHLPSGGRDIALSPSLRAQPGWWRIEEAWKDLELVLQDSERLLEGLPPPARGGLPASNWEWEQPTILGHCQELRFEGNAILAPASERGLATPEAGMVAWGSTGNEISLSAAPLGVTEYLRSNLFGPRDTAVLTGATLTTEGSFRFLKRRLGVEGEELVLGTSFDYQSALLYVPADIPEPDRTGYEAALEAALVEIARAAEGRTLVLFTSHAALRAMHSRVGPRLEKDDIMVLGQGVDGSPRQLLALFQERSRVVLLGTASFWEGVDVDGDALKVLVMVRLPFPVPTDPLFAARAQLFDDPFNEFAIPQAVLRFKQGFGRLIRRRTDRGVVVVLDRRLESRSYGSAFLDSLPPCVVKKGPWRQLGPAIRNWLAVTP